MCIFYLIEFNRATVRSVTKTWSVAVLNKKYIYSYLKCAVYDKLLKPRQSFLITQSLRVVDLRTRNDSLAVRSFGFHYNGDKLTSLCCKN